MHMVFKPAKNATLPLWFSEVYKGLMFLPTFDLKQYHGTVEVFKIRYFVMHKVESCCLSSFSQNFLVIYMGFLLAIFFSLR